jgi:hypothetical protein
MTIGNITTILFCGTSIAAGASLGVLRSKIFSEKTEGRLHYIFYFIAGGIFLSGVLFPICYRTEFFSPPDWLSITAMILAISFSIALFIFTKKFMVVKSIYKISDLDPIINKFTSLADKNEIKLFGGDLNFLGNSPAEIDSNIQYTHLRSLSFKKISLLCEEPDNSTKRIRYGKICSEIPNVSIRFYNPEKADLRIRGRIIEVNGSSKLLMYTKAATPGFYQAIETDTANSNGALYNKIWDLAWSLASEPDHSQIQSYITIFKDGR